MNRVHAPVELGQAQARDVVVGPRGAAAAVARSELRHNLRGQQARHCVATVTKCEWAQRQGVGGKGRNAPKSLTRSSRDREVSQNGNASFGGWQARVSYVTVVTGVVCDQTKESATSSRPVRRRRGPMTALRFAEEMQWGCTGDARSSLKF